MRIRRQLWCLPLRLLSLKARNAFIPKISKAVAVRAEEEGRKQENELRERRLHRMTIEGKKELVEILEPIRDQILNQADIVRVLKIENKTDVDILPEIAKLKKLRKLLEKEELKTVEDEIDFEKLEKVIKNRFFFTQSGELYGGLGGFIDFGPYGTTLKRNIIQRWRDIFMASENAFEIETSMVTHEKILDASGHVKKFSDYVVKDVKNGECFRADKLILNYLEKQLNTEPKEKIKIEKLKLKVESLSKSELSDLITKYDIKSPISGNELSEAMEFNLMFKCQVGPEGKAMAYLRPETAQGIFSNFKLMRNKSLPFVVGQVGHSFRNEISTGNGLIRTREFQMAELEHFYDPMSAEFEAYNDEIFNKLVPIWTAEDQLNGETVTAIPLKTLLNNSMGSYLMVHYIYTIYNFCEKIGIDTSKIRFRQQLKEELAHYASICFDLECRLSIGWVECAGLADRGCYDIENHSISSGQQLSVPRLLEEPVEREVTTIQINPKAIRKVVKNKKKLAITKSIIEAEISRMSTEDLDKESHSIDIENTTIVIKKSDISVDKKIKKITKDSLTPHVIEPSFGINRLVQAVLEHSFRLRQADGRRFFVFAPSVAPVKCSVLTIARSKSDNPMRVVADKIKNSLIAAKIAFESDFSGNAIGRKYMKSDEVGIPFAIVVDHQTLECPSPTTVTLRERDTLNQIRVPTDKVPDLICSLSKEEVSFADLQQTFISQEDYLSSDLKSCYLSDPLFTKERLITGAIELVEKGTYSRDDILSALEELRAKI